MVKLPTPGNNPTRYNAVRNVARDARLESRKIMLTPPGDMLARKPKKRKINAVRGGYAHYMMTLIIIARGL